MRRHQAFAQGPVSERERRVRVYEEAPGFRPEPRAAGGVEVAVGQMRRGER
jgi:hypothetical protein